MTELQQVLESINWGLVAPLLIIQLILIVTALVDLIRIKNTNGPKWLWVLIILFINIIGPIIYFVIGRRQNG
ncbi:PLDc_N domain-containing protein [Rossellomorea vietnamensis]|uniref:PLDc_N domain-containing protein n=1 Tax=Rossellomorea vietnamensis TaxID=218284 RepID=A0A5D4NX23_9BACI|nr:PLD nuclease N-terminal domain-containing protein [Rossellomorea vietnamensis]TYS18797.1 PLDc_N domain-containing protein [Rossellomorea vietnamensis]